MIGNFTFFTKKGSRMTIKIQCTEKKLDQVINKEMFEAEFEKIDELFENNIVLELNREIMAKFNSIDLKINNIYKDVYPLDFPPEIEFEIIFVPESFKDEIINNFAINTEEPLGFHAVTTGEGFLVDKDGNESYYNKKFQTFMFIPENATFIENLFSDSDPLSFLYSSANTLTHELSHMLIFAKSSGGLAPYDVDMLFDMSEFDNNVDDCILGSNLEEYEEYYISHDAMLDCNQVLENIVEEEGFSLLKKLDLHLDKKLEKIEIISSLYENKKEFLIKQEKVKDFLSY